MRAFWAIVLLTVRDSWRSNVFKILLFLLLLAAVLIPWQVTSEGNSADSYIKTALLYSLQSVIWLLALSSTWLGGAAMTKDVDSYQLHLVVTKPVSRIKVFFAKYTAVCLMNVFLLMIAGGLVYWGIMYQFNTRDFDAAERKKVADEILTARRVFWPERESIDKLTQEKFNEKRRLADDNRMPNSEEVNRQIMDEAKREVIAGEGRIKANELREFIYTGLPNDNKKPLFLRFRPHIGEIGGNKQRITMSGWAVGVPRLAETDPNRPASTASNGAETGVTASYQLYPQEVYRSEVQGGQFHELILPAEWKVVTPDGKVNLLYGNLDAKGETQFFQQEDGPKLLMTAGGFGGNYVRGLLVSVLLLLTITALSCAAAGSFSMATSVFFILAYMMFGSFSLYLVNSTFLSSTSDYIGHYMGKIILYVVIPVQNFDVSELLYNGELIEWSHLNEVFWFYFVLRALPWALLGCWAYRRRELGLAVKK